MNYSIVFYILGWILNVEAAFMLLPCIVAVIYGETAGWCFPIVMGISFLIGTPLVIRKPKNTVFYTAEAFVAVSLGWILLSIKGGLPFRISGYITNPVDALFETVSGFTTTGASILTDVEVLPHCLLFWRSFTHWIGGMGVLVFILSLLPSLGGGGTHMNLMKAESPGPSVSRMLPTVKSTAKILYEIYIGLTILQIILLLLGKMPLFDALTITFGTAGTGGFAIKNSSMMDYSPYLQNVTTIFMILFGVNFNAYFFILIRKFRQAFGSEEVRSYLLIIAVSIAIITVNIMPMYSGLSESLRHAAFQVASIITTTGYATANFDEWPELSRAILVLLMFIGACAGSTGGGIKVSRVVILMKTACKEMTQVLHPNAVKKVKMDGKLVEHEVVRSTNVFLVVYLVIFAASVLLVSLDNFDAVTNFTAVAATFNDVGPGLGMVGPVGNYSAYSNFSKLVLTFDMLAGRLEIFPLLILFSRDTWRKF